MQLNEMHIIGKIGWAMLILSTLFSIFMIIHISLYGQENAPTNNDVMSPTPTIPNMPPIQKPFDWNKLIELVGALIVVIGSIYGGSWYQSKWGKAISVLVNVAKQIEQAGLGDNGKVIEDNKQTIDNLKEQIKLVLANNKDPTLNQWFKDNVIDKHITPKE